MFTISKLFWFFVILECIHQLQCSEIDGDKISMERCLNKFNVTHEVFENKPKMAEMLCQVLKNVPDDNQQMEVCFGKFNMTPTERIDPSDLIAELKIRCIAMCISPNLDGDDKFKRAYELFCPSFENTRENNENLQTYLSKYNVSIIRTFDMHMNGIEGVKGTCALSSIHPALTKILNDNYGRNGTMVESICKSFESSPENNQKLDTCFTNYDKSLMHTFYLTDEVKWICTLKCILPYTFDLNTFRTIWPKWCSGYEAQPDQICRSIEMTPENHAKEQACFGKYSAPKFEPYTFDDVARLKFKCATLCATLELAKVAWQLDEEGVKLVESKCPSVETPTQHIRQIDDRNSKMGNSF